jgi:hypothetical protein
VIATDAGFRYRGRVFTEQEIALLDDLVESNPGLSRYALSRLACEALEWRQENGCLRDMVCRSAMLALHRAGRIKLPPPRAHFANNALRHREAEPVQIDQTPVEAALRALGRIDMFQVRRTPDERLVNGLLHAHHYLGYTRPVGEHLKFLFCARGRPIACAAWSSAPRHLGPRDRFIGWSKEARGRNVRFLAYNTRFLVLPWVRVPYLASHLLGQMARRVSREWEALYGHPIFYLESFITPSRHAGTCYRAANWHFLGLTTGRGKNDQTMKPNRPRKEVLGYPLTPRFRERLGSL